MPFRVVVDTNVWVSSLINPFGHPATIRKYFARGAFVAIFSEPILEEIAEVLNRPRIKNKYNISEKDIRELLILIEEKAEHVLLSMDVDICRDKNDNFIIETAIKGKAKYLVTRDDDLKFDTKTSLFLLQHKISVTSVSKFLKLF